MNKALPRLLLAAVLVLAACSPKPANRDAGAPTPIPASGERIWIKPLINKSEIEAIDTWPRDSLERTALLNKFGETETKLRSEFERCEKVGLYEIVFDSAQATMRVQLTIGHARLIQDTLTMPAFFHVDALATGQTYDFAFNPRAIVARGKREPKPFYYTGLLLAEYRNSFPYREIVYLFCSPSR
jgi:hypothetical protein